MNFITNIDFPREVIEGDEFEFTLTVDQNLTGYKARCKIFDRSSNEINLNTENDGGSDSEILITASTISTILVTVAKDLTDNFDDKIYIEVQIENSTGTIIRTIYKDILPLTQSKFSED